MAVCVSKFSGPASVTMSVSVFMLILFALVAQKCNSASVPVINNVPDDLKFLTSSRILMDHTSSSPKFIRSNDKNQQVIIKPKLQEDTDSTLKTVLPPSVEDLSKSSKPEKLPEDSQDSLSASSSSLHVARCRANCIEKFNTQDANNGATSTILDTTTSAEEMHLLPILRLKRKKRSFWPSLNGRMIFEKFVNMEKSPWSCLRDSSDCFTCWESCELLEPGTQKEVASSLSTSATQLPQPQENGKGDEVQTAAAPSSNLHQKEITTENKKMESKSKQSIISCSELLLDSTKCTVGCQVACSFYERLLTKKEKEQYQQQQQNAFTGVDPVVATKQDSVVRIVPGKISWEREARNGNKEDALSSPGGEESDSPVVYVVIQEYPDRKWRQIAQTAETEIEIPMELTSTMKTKLRFVRVLVVGPEGLLSVYSPEKQEQLSDNNNISREKMLEAQNEITTASTVKETVPSIAAEMEFITTTELNADSFDEPIVAKVVTQSPSSQVSSSSTMELVVTGFMEDNLFDGDGMEEEPFELRRVSLIHQKSLVIAELEWNEIGNDPSQEYLITWELTGGGLKGHLVTDSTSVTLSLWPDTVYQIQVELFEQNLDGDGEQPAEPSSTVSLKSLPLTVDTSEASFPLESPSALLGNNDEEEDDQEDESEQEGNEREDGEEEESAHKSITGFLNMTLVLGISVTALILVLVILTLAAFTWTRTRSLSTSKVGCVSGKGGRCCYKGCFSDSTDPELLLSQDELLDDSNTLPVSFYKVGLSKQGKTFINPVSNISIVPSTVYTISSSRSAEIPHPSFVYCNDYCIADSPNLPKLLSPISSVAPSKFTSSQFNNEANEIQCATNFS